MVIVKIKFPLIIDQAKKKMVVIPFLERLAEGLRHFNELRNGGSPGSRSKGAGEQGGGRTHPSVTH